MKTKKITIDSFTEAVGQCNLIFAINNKIWEIEELKKDVRILSKKDKYILFSEQVNFKIIEASTGGYRFSQRSAIVDRIEIGWSLNANTSFDFCDFFLSLYIYSGTHAYSFLVGKNKGSNDGYLVQTNEDELLILDGGMGRVKFSSVEDFQRVIKLCDEYLAKFNSFLKGEKLIPHFNEPIVVFD